MDNIFNILGLSSIITILIVILTLVIIKKGIKIVSQSDVYVVERAGFKDLLIPALRGIILSIDSELLKIIIRRPSEWIR